MPCMLLCCMETGVVATSEHGHKLKDVQDTAPSSPANAGAASSAAARRIEYLRLAIHFSIAGNVTSRLPRGEAHHEVLHFRLDLRILYRRSAILARAPKYAAFVRIKIHIAEISRTRGQSVTL